MARNVVTHLIDDLDGSNVGVKTVSFTYGGSQYDIELSEDNRMEFDSLMARYIKAGRRRRGNPSQRTSKLGYGMGKEIRRWLGEHGEEVRPTGRLSDEQIGRYLAAHPGLQVHK